MKKSVKEIVNESEDLHLIKITKPNKRDYNTWSFSVNDKSSKLYGISDFLYNYKYQIVTLRRGNHYFLSYKIYFDDEFEYFVDTRKSIHRKSSSKYVDGTINYYVYSNDISPRKNDSSFKFTKMEMEQNNIDNFLDLCAYFEDYSSIGTGLTRDIRNIVVMDIDVDCTKESNKELLNDLLLKFGKYNTLPDFYIFNHESNHVQLQWLIKSLKYKDVDNSVKYEIINSLKNDTNKSREVNLKGTNFTTLTNYGEAYKLFTYSLTCIVPKHKFGDKEYTYWKAKNFYSAYRKKFNLELKVPLYNGHEIYYMSQEEMDYNFSTKEGRKIYYDEAYTFEELTFKTKDIVTKIINKTTEKKKKEIINTKDDDDEITDIKENKVKATARNGFVLECTRNVTWKIAIEQGFRNYDDIKNLSPYDIDLFRKKILRIVKKKFKDEDKKYDGHWPGTTNISKYNKSEFDITFKGSFNWAIHNFEYKGYSNEQRIRSASTRAIGKDVKISLVDYTRNIKKMSRDDLLNEVNRILKLSGEKEISLTSLKKYIRESKDMNDDERTKLYNIVFDTFTDGIKKNYSKININIIKYLNGESV